MALFGKTLKDWKSTFTALNPFGAAKLKQESESLQTFAKSLTRVGNDGKWATSITQAFSNNISGLSEKSKVTANQIGNLAFRVRTGSMSLEEYNLRVKELTATENAATISTNALAIGMNLLAQALPIIVFSLITSAIQKYKREQEDIRKAQDEAAESAKSEIEELNNLYTKYKQLSDEVKTNDSVKSDLESTTNDLIKLLGIEEDKIDTLISKYGSLDNAIDSVVKKTLIENQAALGTDVQNKRKDLSKKFSQSDAQLYNKYDRFYYYAEQEEIDKVEEILNSLGLGNYTTKTFSDQNTYQLDIVFDRKFDTSTISGIRELYDTYDEILKQLQQQFGSDVYNTSFYKMIYNRMNEIKEPLDAYNEALEVFDDNISRQIILDKKMQGSLPETVEDFVIWREELLETAKANNSYFEESDIEAGIDNALRSMAEFSQYMTDASRRSEPVDFAITPKFTVNESDISAGLEELKESLEDELKNADLFDKAIEAMTKGESISFDDMMKLVGLDPSLTDKFSQTADGYKATLEDLTNARAQYVEETQSSLAESISANNAYVSQIQQNIADLQTKRTEYAKHVNSQQDVENLKKYDAQIAYQQELLEKTKQVIAESSLYQGELNNSYSSTSETLKDYNELLKEISDKESLLDSVHKEMNSDGQISVSTYQKLISAGQDYADLVEIENGVITVSEEKIKNLTKKKLEDEIATLQLALAEERYNSAMSNRGLSVKTEREAELEADIATKQKLYDIWNNYTPSDTSSKTNNSATKKQYSNELQLLKDALNDRKITYEQFLQQWQALNDKYHNMSEDEGGISDYEWQQNNRSIIAERKNAYEEEKKTLQELYEAGAISLSEYNARVDYALNHWLGGYAQLSDDFKDKTKENAEFAKTHFFDEIDRELEDLENKYDKTGDVSFLNQRETTARNGINQANAKLKGLYAQGLTDANEDLQFWLDKQKKYNSELQSILDERVNIVEDNLDKQLNAYDRELDNTGDTSIYYKEIDSIESARTELIDLIQQYGELGYTENSDKIKSLRKKYQDLGDDIVDVYDKIGDSITKSIDEQIETVDREIKNGDISKYQVKLNILADGKKQIQELIDTLLELGYTENSTIVKSLKKQLVDYEDEIVDITKDRADAQIDAFNEVMSEQKEQLDKYKDEQDEIFDAKIKALEDEKKALEKQNDEIEKQEKAQERIKDLLDAQRGVYKSLRMVYTGNGGWSIKATQESLDALKKVEEENEKAAREDKVDALDEQIDAIKEQKSAFDETVEKQIKAIDDDVDKFEDIMEKSYKVYSQLDSVFIESIMGKEEADKYNQRFTDIAKEAGIELTETESTSEIQTKTRAIDNQRKASRRLIKTTETATEKLDAFADKMQDEFGVGNVDLTKRPFVSGDKMRKAGYDVDKDGTSTVYSSTHFVWQGDEEHGQYVAVHVTPILPNGEVLSERELEDYVYGQLEGSSDILKADSKGLILKVDSDLNLSEKDISSLDNGKLTKHMEKVLDDIDQWDIDLHNVQEEWMNLYFAAYGKPNQKAKTRSINVFGEEKLDGFLGLVQQVAKGIIPLRDVGIGLSSEALAQLNGASNVAQNQTVNTNSFNPVITNNFTITTPNGNAEEIKNAVNEIVDTKIVAGFKAFYDGYYQQSMKEMYGH